MEAQQLQFVLRDQLDLLTFVPPHQHSARRQESSFLTRLRRRRHAKVAWPAAAPLGQAQHIGVFAVQHPVAVVAGIAEEPCLVLVILLHVGVPIEMIGAEVE